MRLLTASTALFSVALMLACGGGGGGGGVGAASTYESPAFHTYEYKGDRWKFANDTKVVWTWKNMSGSAVEGKWTRDGDEILIDWDPNATNNSTRHSKIKQISDCEMAQWYREFADGKVKDSDSQLYVKQVPECTGRRR